MPKLSGDLTQRDSTFRQKLEALINTHSLENTSDTPDYLLADFMIHCLTIFNGTVNARREWHSTENTKGWAEFKSVPERIKERVMVDMGQASMCWSDAYSRDGEFDSNMATDIGDKLCQFIMNEIEAGKSVIV